MIRELYSAVGMYAKEIYLPHSCGQESPLDEVVLVLLGLSSFVFGMEQFRCFL